MIHETQRWGRFQHLAALQFHAVAGIRRMLVQHRSLDFAEHDARLESTAGKHTRADMRLAQPHESHKTIAWCFENRCMVMGHEKNSNDHSEQESTICLGHRS